VANSKWIAVWTTVKLLNTLSTINIGLFEILKFSLGKPLKLLGCLRQRSFRICEKNGVKKETLYVLRMYYLGKISGV
jgi:hypothetical protein